MFLPPWAPEYAKACADFFIASTKAGSVLQMLLYLAAGVASMLVVLLWGVTSICAIGTGLLRLLGIYGSRRSGLQLIALGLANFYTPPLIGPWTVLPLTAYLLWWLRRDAKLLEAARRQRKS